MKPSLSLRSERERTYGEERVVWYIFVRPVLQPDDLPELRAGEDDESGVHLELAPAFREGEFELENVLDRDEDFVGCQGGVGAVGGRTARAGRHFVGEGAGGCEDRREVKQLSGWDVWDVMSIRNDPVMSRIGEKGKMAREKMICVAGREKEGDGRRGGGEEERRGRARDNLLDVGLVMTVGKKGERERDG